MKKITLLLLIGVLVIPNIYSQCLSLEGDSPAFEINIPSGVQIDSAFLIISNYDATDGIRSRGRSFNNFEDTSWFEENGKFSILDKVLIGPITADFQVHPAFYGACSKPLDYAKFEWKVEVYCSGLDGTVINFSGNLTDNLAIPTNIGDVFSGLNTISGAIDVILKGEGVSLYPDKDYDGFGDINSDSTIFCSEWCDMFVDNNLDCDDENPNINPDAEEIPNNSIDEDCDGMDLVSSVYELSSTTVKIYPNPATDIVNIDVEGELKYQVSLYSLDGKLIESLYDSNHMSVETIAIGSYILIIKDLKTGHQIVERIIVEK